MASIKVYMKNEEKEKKIIGTPDVPKSLSKKFQNQKGQVLYYIDKNYGIKRGLMQKMDFRNTLVKHPKMCKIDIKINRV